MSLISSSLLLQQCPTHFSYSVSVSGRLIKNCSSELTFVSQPRRTLCVFVTFFHDEISPECDNHLRACDTRTDQFATWWYSSFVRCSFQYSFKITRSILMYFLSRLFSIYFVSVYVVKPFDSTDWVTASSERFGFQISDNLSRTIPDFPMPMLILFSLVEILMPMYLKCSTNFRCLLNLNF